MNTLRKYPIFLTLKEIQDKASMKKINSRYLNNLPIFGGELVAPIVNSLGLNEISIEDFAPYQQYLAENAKEPTQSLSTLGTAGKVIDTAQKLGSLIPEAGEIIGLANEAYNALIGIFYHPHISIQNKLKDEGIDIFLDDVYIINPQYPDDTDPKHYQILMPNGTIADAKDQARYICLIFYMTVLGHPDKWVNRISKDELNYLFPPNNSQWPAMFEQLSIVHGHANEYLVK